MILVSLLLTGSTEPVEASLKQVAGKGQGRGFPHWEGLATPIGSSIRCLLAQYCFRSLAQTASGSW